MKSAFDRKEPNSVINNCLLVCRVRPEISYIRPLWLSALSADIKLFGAINEIDDCSVLQRLLNISVSQWYEENVMQLNLSKYMLIPFYRGEIFSTLVTNIQGTQLQQ